MKKEFINDFKARHFYFRQRVVVTRHEFKDVQAASWEEQMNNHCSDDPSKGIEMVGYIKRTIDFGSSEFLITEHQDNIADLYQAIMDLPLPMDYQTRQGLPNYTPDMDCNHLTFMFPENNGEVFSVSKYSDGISIWAKNGSESISFDKPLTLEKFKEILYLKALGYTQCLSCKQWFPRSVQMRNIWAGRYCPECWNKPEIKKAYDNFMSYHD